MKLINFFVAVASFTLSISVLATTEFKKYTPASTILLNQLQGQIRSTLLAVSDNETNAGKSMRDFHYSLSLPAQEVTYLGLVLELTNADNGYEVLSVTPGSPAEKLSIKSKDRILKINDINIDNSTSDTAVRLIHDIRPGDILKMTVKSAEGNREITTTLVGQYLPEIKLEFGTNTNFILMETSNLDSNDKSSKACGRVSIFYNTPISRDIYPATINKIDNDHLKKNRNTFRLPVGKHTIFLREHIDNKELHGKNKNKIKPIEIEVMADTKYHLGAKFNRTKKFKTLNGEYWTPVHWKTSNQKCEL